MLNYSYEMIAKLILGATSLLGFSAVVLGAFSAHALQTLLTANGRVETFTTANQYHFFHVLALLVVGMLMKETSQAPTLLMVAAIGFFIGIALFSGSLYVLALTNWKILGAVAPFGGAALLVGWGALGWFCFKAAL